MNRRNQTSFDDSVEDYLDDNSFLLSRELTTLGQVLARLAKNPDYFMIKNHQEIITRILREEYTRIKKLNELNNIAQRRRIKHNRESRHPVTDHALIRYLERKHGINMSAIKDEIYQQIRPYFHPGRNIIHKGGLKYLTDGLTVVTVMTPDMETGETKEIELEQGRKLQRQEQEKGGCEKAATIQPCAKAIAQIKNIIRVKKWRLPLSIWQP